MAEATCRTCGSTYQTGEGWEAHTYEACMILALRRQVARMRACCRCPCHSVVSDLESCWCACSPEQP